MTIVRNKHAAAPPYIKTPLYYHGAQVLVTCFPPSSFLVLVHRASELIALSAAEFNLGSSLRIAAALATSRKGGNKHGGKGDVPLRPFVGKYTGKIPSINVSVKQALERAGRNNRSYFDIRGRAVFQH